jgi:hypothetical protein
MNSEESIIVIECYLMILYQVLRLYEANSEQLHFRVKNVVMYLQDTVLGIAWGGGGDKSREMYTVRVEGVISVKS